MTTSRLPLPALLVVAAALTACQSAAPAPAAPTTSAPAPTSTAATSAPSSATTSAEAAPGGGGGSSRCTLDDLAASLGNSSSASGDPNAKGGQRITAVVWTNTSDGTCTMTGFGGVDLQGVDDPMGPVYSLPRAQVEASTVTLEPGGTAHSTITWLSPEDLTGWTPDRIVITPPDETRSAVVEWPGGALLRQDGATRPGTYLGPVRPGTEG
jgi:hypothetical protein